MLELKKWMQGDDAKILTFVHPCYLRDIPLAQIAVEAVWAWSNTAREEACVKMKTTWLQREDARVGKETYLLHVGTLPTFHLLTSASNFRRAQTLNGERRHVCQGGVRMRRKVTDGERKLTCSHVAHFADIPLAHIAVEVFTKAQHCVMGYLLVRT